MHSVENALAYARAQRQPFIEALCDLLRIPSISTLPQHKGDIDRAAEWLAGRLTAIGFNGVELLGTLGYPVVYGEWLEAGPAAPTLLVYGHYDVQPVDPLDQWRTLPFEPTLIGDKLFCRGASDDKGQAFAVLAAAESYLTGGDLPINLKVMLEGEEEVSSPYMPAFVADQRARLAADAVLICDGAILGPRSPLIAYGVRGGVHMEIEVCGPAHDLHSGTYGGAVDNPFNVLVRILAGLQDGASHRVLVPGFYDRVRPLDADEAAMLARSPMDDAEVMRLTGAPAVDGEAGYSTAERASVRPTFDIHGMPGGFTGEGKKTVIPARAAAKFSFRLVPDQDPDEIAGLVTRHIQNITPPTVQVAVRLLGTALPAVIDYRHPAIRAADEAYFRGFGARPLYLREGGSIPIIADFQQVLNVPVVMMGLGLHDDNIHAPNESFSLPNFYRGIDTLIHYFDCLAAGRG